MQGDKEDGHGTDAIMTERTAVNPSRPPISALQLDRSAIAIGTSHGA
jgi:fructose-bisphosphate aldolase class II